MQIEPQKREEILRRLEDIEAKQQVRILFAIESGSRAWGFPSPDSDYDVRFVYAHPRDWYLSLYPGRDVIELPLEDDLDISGWDLRKALTLLLKPNPVLLEWLRSPLFYRAEPAATDRIVRLGERVAHWQPSLHHYLHLGESQYRRFIAGNERVALKKYLYVIRPVLALLWLRAHPGRPVPMTLPELRRGVSLPTGVNSFLDDMLERKSRTKELGEGPRHAAVDTMIEAAFAAAHEGSSTPPPKPPDLVEEAETLFRDLMG